MSTAERRPTSRSTRAKRSGSTTSYIQTTFKRRPNDGDARHVPGSAGDQFWAGTTWAQRAFAERGARAVACFAHSGCLLGVARSRRGLRGHEVGKKRAPGASVDSRYARSAKVGPSPFLNKAETLLKRYWAGADWQAREEILHSLKWLLNLARLPAARPGKGRTRKSPRRHRRVPLEA